MTTGTVLSLEMATRFERLKLISRAKKDTGLQAALYEKCRRDTKFWFNHFAWTFNPRVDPYHFPFNLYGFQEEIVAITEQAIMTGEPTGYKKSRDLGLTWILLGVLYKHWLFEPGSDFHLTSITRDEVDKKGVKSTMFEKLRYLHRKHPKWMVPTLSREHDGYMKFINPKNGNSITGQAPTVDFGRSQRYKAVMMDEFAKLPHAKASYETVAQSTNCILMPYTPYGKDTHAYTLNHREDTEIVELKYTG